MRRALFSNAMVLRHGSTVPVYDKYFNSKNGHVCPAVFLLKSGLGVDTKYDKELMVLAQFYRV
jgi:hypothetical protein